MCWFTQFSELFPRRMDLEKDRKNNEEVENGCVERGDTRKIDDEMDRGGGR